MQRRLRLRDWLAIQIESGQFSGLEWLDKSRRIFRVPWKHGSRQSWCEERDAAVFREWAVYTGRYDARKMKPNPRRWKTNFRCALNALPDIEEVTEKSCTRGNNAFKVYRMKPMPRAITYKVSDDLAYTRLDKYKGNEQENVEFDGIYQWGNYRDNKSVPYMQGEDRGVYYADQDRRAHPGLWPIQEVEQAVPDDEQIVAIVDELQQLQQMHIDHTTTTSGSGSCSTTPDSVCDSYGFSSPDQGSYSVYPSLMAHM